MWSDVCFVYFNIKQTSNKNHTGLICKSVLAVSIIIYSILIQLYNNYSYILISLEFLYHSLLETDHPFNTCINHKIFEISCVRSIIEVARFCTGLCIPQNTDSVQIMQINPHCSHCWNEQQEPLLYSIIQLEPISNYNKEMDSSWTLDEVTIVLHWY